MRFLRFIFLGLSLAFATVTVNVTTADAQCAMCSLNAENSTQNGNHQGKGLNDGIIFLLAMPFIIGGGVAILWYKKFRKKEEKNTSYF